MSRSLAVPLLVATLFFVPQISASDFLGRNNQLFATPVTKQNVEEELLNALQEAVAAVSNHDVKNLQGIVKSMQASYFAMPKQKDGTVSNPAMRYLVHSYFMKEHGWLIRGLEPLRAGKAKMDQPKEFLVKNKMPMFIDMFFQGQNMKGYHLSDVVALVAAFEHLILNESAFMLETAYKLNQFGRDKVLTQPDADQVLESFLFIFAVGTQGQSESLNATTHETDLANIKKLWPAWSAREMLVKDIQHNLAFNQQSTTNPFKEASFSFPDVLQVAEATSMRFGGVHNAECGDLKAGLTQMDPHLTGRVSLRRFYAEKQIGHWHLRESTSFLRQLGALDESGRDPMVIIPNYLTAVSNCETPSQYFSVCCIQECEGLLQALETEIKAPEAEPAQILDFVAKLPSPTISAPRNLSAPLVDALLQISTFHSGKVVLHGRLFAQWMHFAFPHECPYPHMTHSNNPLTAAEWKRQNKGAVTYTQEEYTQVMEADEDCEDIADPMAMFTLEEEMRHSDRPVPGPQMRQSSVGVVLAQVTAVVFVIINLLRTGLPVMQKWLGTSKEGNDYSLKLFTSPVNAAGN